MPSTVDPSTIALGPGKLHVDVANAATDLFANISSSLIATLSSVLAQPLAAPSSVGGIVSANDVSHVILAAQGPFYVGNLGDDIKNLMRVVRDDTEAEIFSPQVNDYIEITGFSPGTIGDGFISGNLTVNFSAAIPSGVTYKIYFGKRATVSALPNNLASFPAIRRSPDRVRFPEFARTGLAPTSVAVPQNIVSGAYPDPYMAQWKAVLRGSPSFPNPAFGGSAGFVNVGTKKNVVDSDDATPAGGQGAAFLAVYEKNLIGSGVIGVGNPLTRINASNTATLNPGGGLPTTVELAASDFFRTGSATSIHLGSDMLEVTFADGSKECFVILALDVANGRRATVATLGGASPTFSTTSVTVKWIRTNFFVGGDNDGAGLSGFLYSGMYHCVPSNITDAPNSEIPQAPPFFASAQEPNFTNTWGQQAFTWGYHYQNVSIFATLGTIGQRVVTGELWGDGSVSTLGRLIGMKSNRSSTVTVTTNIGSSWDPKQTSIIIANFGGASAVTWTLTIAGGFAPLAASFVDEAQIIVSFASVTADTAGENSTVVWPANFKFSGNDADVTGPAGRVMIFKALLVGGTTWFLTRTDYV
jgi:hypothetical protein